MSVHCLAPLAQTVHVDDPDQVIKFVMNGELNGFPLGALGHFTVSQKHIGPVREFIDIFCVQGYTESYGQTLPE